MLMLPAYILFHKKAFIITLHNEMWENLSSLQSQKKMLKHILILKMLEISGYACLLTRFSLLFL